MSVLSLPFQKPPLSGFLRWIYTLGIICSHNEAREWILNNFIHLSCNRDYGLPVAPQTEEKQMVLDVWRGPNMEMFGNNPFLEFRAIDYDPMDLGICSANVVDIATQAIELGFYPVLFLDESKLPFSTQFGLNLLYPHHVMIRSVNSDSGCFGVVGLGGNSQTDGYGRLGTFSITTEELRLAVASMEAESRDKRVVGGLGGLSALLRYHPPPNRLFPFETDLRPDLIKAAIHDYLACTDLASSNMLKLDSQVYGSAVFSELASYFSKVSKHLISGYHRRDVRHLHVLEEYHQLMVTRINVLLQRCMISQSGKATTAAATFAEIASALRLLKLQLIMRYRWQDPGDFEWVAKQLKIIGEKSRISMEEIGSLL